MRRARATGWLVTVLVSAAVIGCVTTAAAPPPTRASDKGEALDKDVPLVPLPPLPREGAAPMAPLPARADVPAPVEGKPPAVTAQQLYEQARKRYATMDSYIVRLQRREVVNGRMCPDE